MIRLIQALLCGGIAAAVMCSVPTASSAADAAAEEEQIARSLATMLQAARTVISNNQALINDEKIGDKGLDAEKVLGDALALYKAQTGMDPTAVDPQSRQGRLLRAQMDAITKVVTEVQPIINRPGIGFKGVIPAAFARMVNDEFQEKTGDEAEIKVTAPPNLIRNRKTRPDTWEAEMIASRLSKPDWPKGQPLTAIAEKNGREAFRLMIPEYYAASCLACHGSPKGEIDITGYPKEGGSEGDLAGVISVSIFRQ